MIYRDDNAPPDIDRSILVACISGFAHGIDRATGAVRWVRDLDSRGPVFVALRYGVLALSANVPELTRLDYHTGQPLWAVPTSRPGRAAILIESDRIVCAKGGWIDCFDHDGRHLWTQEVQGHGDGAVALALPGNVAQADESDPRREYRY